MSIFARHQVLEKNSILLLIGILLVIAIGGIVEITPLFYLKSTIEKVDGCGPIRRSSSPAATSTSARAATSAIRR
jgi:cbb3-type cytochrome oxidase cytochrome c subunit